MLKTLTRISSHSSIRVKLDFFWWFWKISGYSLTVDRAGTLYEPNPSKFISRSSIGEGVYATLIHVPKVGSALLDSSIYIESIQPVFTWIEHIPYRRLAETCTFTRPHACAIIKQLTSPPACLIDSSRLRVLHADWPILG